MTERILQWMGDNPQHKYFEVSQNDGAGYCQCENCKALDEKEESYQGSLLYCINRIAEKVKEQFPDKYIITFLFGNIQAI